MSLPRADCRVSGGCVAGDQEIASGCVMRELVDLGHRLPAPRHLHVSLAAVFPDVRRLRSQSAEPEQDANRKAQQQRCAHKPAVPASCIDLSSCDRDQERPTDHKCGNGQDEGALLHRAKLRPTHTDCRMTGVVTAGDQEIAGA